MTADVYEKIIEIAKEGIEILPKEKSYEIMSAAMLTLLTSIMGVCGGAMSAEKGLSENISYIEGKCCEYCIKKESSDCPINSADPWSRWKNYCNEFARGLK